MTNKKLTSEQIQSLYDFTAAHFVEWYDLQTELVDHLANGIEEKWQDDPKLSFHEALNFEFKKFGVFGFEDVICSQKKALTKVYNKLVWKFVKNSFSMPTAIFLFSIIFLLIRLFADDKYGQHYFFGFTGLVILFFIILHFKIKHIKKERKKLHNKKYLLEDIIYKGGDYTVLVAGVVPQFILRINNIENLYLQLLISLLVTITVMFFYIILYIMPAKVDNYLSKIYPEFKINAV